MKTSVDIVTGAGAATNRKAERDSLNVGDLFKGQADSDRVYMHTGCRSCPPTERSVNVVVGNKTYTHELYPTLGRLPNGKDIIGYQSIQVAGEVTPGEDGANFTTNGKRKVTVVGKAKLKLDM